MPMAVQVHNWPTCDLDDCIGICLHAGGRCLAHATDEDRDGALEQISQSGHVDARGVTISATLLEKILERAPRDPNDSRMPMLTGAQFDWATFEGEAWF